MAAMLTAPSQSTQCAQWYTDHHPWLINWLTRQVACCARAEDICHDAFVRLLNKPVMPDALSPRAYLTRIAHGLMVDDCRRRDIEQAFFQQMQYLAQDNLHLSPESQQIMLDTLYQIDAMLDGLKPKVRQAFLLYRLDNMKQADIAEHLQVSLSSVEKYLKHALLHCYKLHYA